MRKRYFLFATVLLAALLSMIIQSSIFAVEPPMLNERIKSVDALLSSPRLIPEKEGKDILENLSVIKEEVKDPRVLYYIAFLISQKAVYDKGRLQVLLTDLDKLLKHPYSSKIGRIKTGSLKTCWNELGKLIADMKKQRPKFGDPTQYLSGRDCLKIINANFVLLTGEGKITTPMVVWRSIEKKIADAFPLWEDKYAELVGKINSGPDKKPEDILSNDELKFVKIFGRVRIYRYQIIGIEQQP